MQTRSISPMQTFRRFAPNILFSRMPVLFCASWREDWWHVAGSAHVVAAKIVENSKGADSKAGCVRTFTFHNKKRRCWGESR